MRRSRLLRGVLAFAFVLASASAGAQDDAPPAPNASPLRGFDLERLELNPGAEGSLLVGLGELLPMGDFRATVAMQYAHEPLVYMNTGKKLAVVGSRATAHLAAAYAPLSWLQVGLQVPLVAFQGGNSTGLAGAGIPEPRAQTLSTPSLSGRVGLLTQESSGILDLAAELGVGVPLGSAEGYSRDDGSVRLSPKLMVGRHFGRIRAGLEVGYVQRDKMLLTERSGDLEDEVGQEVRLGAALSTTGKRLRWELNVRAMLPLTNQPGAVELLPGARYLASPSLELFALAGMGVGSAPGTPLFRLMVGGAFGKVVPTRGPGESSVRCEPGLVRTLKDPIQECPDSDEDGDGIINSVDRCPLVPGDAARGGCSAKDSDGDGIEDMLDECPDRNGPPARNGCPVEDRDKDEVEDSKDSCPDDPGPEDNRGCPVRDFDKDGIENDSDECPNEPGPPERKGCPEMDSDKDGVPNRLDSCVKDVGAANNLGCPANVPPLVEIKSGHLELFEKIYFEASGVVIQSRSLEQLNWVARIVKEHPELPMVVVGAHTDLRSPLDASRRLSQARADAVRQYLISKGAPADRLMAVGFGKTKPKVTPENTYQDREENRRIEFKFVDPLESRGAAPADGAVKPGEVRP
ncbi:OmpA family protein [Myxococcus qinghaiensis]|uniref:OmpA family protein n=1 Tax=Myxococcus qinghaiensis TaxID=2906758 RepID=UPI0020A726B9|nr:OmpA family protein [Myxococcus qinghaiensis]MCP3169632.1 thrombospondin type 3 repeat-containing protein [Myxococcus qinghaiensis]